MHCSKVAEHSDDYLDGDLEPSLQRALEGHMHMCPSCQSRITRERQLRSALARYPVQGPSPGFYDRALAAAAGENSREHHTKWWATGFGGAIAAGLALLIVAGLLLQQPESEPMALANVSMTLHETRTVNLVFAAAERLDDAVLTVQLPPGIELARFNGRDAVRWRTSLSPGQNVLPLDLVAREGAGGELLARLEHAGKTKTFRVRVQVT
jgi:hypothetical protein